MPVLNFCNILRSICYANRARSPILAMRDYKDCYAVLGVSPDTDWETLRAHYKRLISRWHPDRFAADIGQRHLAEERSKRITVAYQALEKYRREYGALPFLLPAAQSDGVQGRAHDADPASDGAGSSYCSEAGMARTDEQGRAKRARRRRVAFAAVFLIAALYFVPDYLGEMMPRDDYPVNSIHEPDIPQIPPGHAEGPGGQLIISIGSTLGDVFAIQGIPTRTQGDTWHYGSSHIRFADGKVIAWSEDAADPLRIARNQPVQLRHGTFKVGSTKDDVRAVQGTPVTETADLWDYGLSRVYFEQNRVVRWEESPMQPLRAAR